MSLDTAIIQQYYAGILRLTPSAATINAYAQLPSYEAAMDAMMNAAVSSVNPITKLYQAAFDRVPDSAGLTNYTAAYGAGAGTMTLKQIATQWTSTIEFTTDYPASMPNADYVGLLYWNVLHRAADPVGAANFTAALNSGKMTRADVLLELSQSPEFSLRIDDHIRGFQEQCALNDPLAYTGTLWDKVPPGPGETFTLTTGIDVFTATTDNATFNAVADAGAANTMNSGDVLTGAGGVNTLNILAQGTTAGLVETNDVQVVNVRSVAASGFSQLLMNGVDVVANNNSLNTLAITNADLGTVYGLNNTVNIAANNAAMTVTYTNAAGTADQGDFVVNNAGTAAIGQSLTVATAAGVVETVAFDLSGTNNIALTTTGAFADTVTIATAGTNTVALTAGATVEQITVTGNGANTIGVLTAAAAGLDFDASASTGSNSLSFAAGLVKSSSTIVGGSGADTLTVASAANLNYATPTISGVETLTINQTGATAFTIGLGRTTGLTDVNLVASAGNNLATTTLSQLANGVDINLTAVAANAAGANLVNALTIASSFAGAADTLNVNVDTTADLLDGAGLLTATGLETLNYVVTGDADNFAATLGGVTSTAGLTNLVVDTTGFTAADEVNVTLGTVTATGRTLDVFDASGADTGVSVAFAAQSLDASAVVTGGSGNDTINLAAYTAAAAGNSVTIIAGQGADTITLNGAGAGVQVVQIGQDDSGITLATADTVNAFLTTVDDLALGAAGDNTAGTGNFVTAGAAVASFALAQTAANTALTTLAATTLSSQIYAVQGVGTDSYVFIDYNLDGTADSVITMVGCNIAGASAIVAGDIIV